MQEHVTKAFVLDVEPVNEADLRVHLFTQELGRVVALAKSARKPSGKLAAHLQPLSIATVRIVERKGMQVVDSLTDERAVSLGAREVQELVSVANLLKQMTDVYHPDPELWQLIEKQKLASAATLRILGFDPAHAQCATCGAGKPKHFLIRNTSYSCTSCLHGARQQLVVS